MRSHSPKGLKKILGAIFNRLTITVIAIIIQALYFAVLIIRFSDYAKWVESCFRLLAILEAVFIIWKDGNPEYKLGWIVLIGLFPQVGSVLFLLYGNGRASARLRRRTEQVRTAHRDALDQTVDLKKAVKKRRLRKTCDYIREYGPYPAWDHTDGKYYPVGEKVFDDMLEDLKKAEHYIFMEYFIIGRGSLWDQVFEILKEKASEGVDVRLIYDDIGSMKVLPRHFLREVRAAGIRVLAFNTMLPIPAVVYNNRDHRKITVIDGYVGYTGGFNISDEYANRVVRFGHWKDAGVRLEGEGVWNLTVMFLNMWNSLRQTDEEYGEFRPHVWHPEPFQGDGVIQPYSDTPLDDESLGENVYLELINQSQNYLYIFTPYLIPDSEMENAMKLAAKRGVDVRLVIPGIPDKRLVYAVTASYFRPLMRAGVKIYAYTPGFIHSKCLLSDDHAAVVGTINFDYRSLFLHFECGALFVENEGVAQALKEDCRQTFLRSQPLTEEILRHHAFGAFLGFFLRIFGPLL